MNIEEIKKRANTTALNQAAWTANYRGDVQYLLSIIEQNMKASTDLIYDNTVLQEKLNQAYQTIRAYEAMENLK